jgi:adenylate kinase family enzyme
MTFFPSRDTTGGAVRVDDSEEVVKKRLHTYYKTTCPVLTVFESEGKLRKVDATQDKDAVYTAVKTHLEGLKGT